MPRRWRSSCGALSARAGAEGFTVNVDLSIGMHSEEVVVELREHMFAARLRLAPNCSDLTTPAGRCMRQAKDTSGRLHHYLPSALLPERARPLAPMAYGSLEPTGVA